jgi:hypothetical protein
MAVCSPSSTPRRAATALRLLGVDHTKLSVYNNGIQRRLTDVHGHVIEPIVG